MRKLFLGILVALVLTQAVEAAGMDYRARALEHLRVLYGEKAAQVELYEGGIARLELTGVEMWMSKYHSTIAGTGTTGSPADDPKAPVKQPDGATTPGSAGQGSLPNDPVGGFRPELPVKSIPTEPEIWGMIAIRVPSGEILSSEQIEIYHAAERVAWERLTQEAGKIEVTLYRRLATLPATEVVEVVIQPTAEITPAIRARLGELRRLYPLIAHPQWSDEEMLGGGGVARDLPVTNVAPSAPDVRGPRPEPDAEYRRQAMAFHDALAAVRRESVQSSLANIETELRALSKQVSREPLDTWISVKLNAAEIRRLATLDSVQNIGELMTIEPAVTGTDPAPGELIKATDTRGRQFADVALVEEPQRNWHWLGAAAGVTLMLGGVAWAKFRRRTKNEAA